MSMPTTLSSVHDSPRTGERRSSVKITRFFFDDDSPEPPVKKRNDDYGPKKDYAASNLTIASLQELPKMNTPEEIRAKRRAKLEEPERLARLAKIEAEKRAVEEAKIEAIRRIEDIEEEKEKAKELAKAIAVAREANKKMMVHVQEQLKVAKENLAKADRKAEEEKKKTQSQQEETTPRRKKKMEARDFFKLLEEENITPRRRKKMEAQDFFKLLEEETTATVSTSVSVVEKTEEIKENVQQEEVKAPEVTAAAEETKPVSETQNQPKPPSPTSPMSSPTSRPAGERSVKKPMRFAKPANVRPRRVSFLVGTKTETIQTSTERQRFVATSTPRSHHAKKSRIAQLAISPITTASPNEKIERKPIAVESPSIHLADDSFDTTISWEETQTEAILTEPVTPTPSETTI